MNTNIRFKFFSFFVLLVMILSLLSPSVVRADDTTPPPEETQEPTSPPEETEETDPTPEGTQEPVSPTEETQEPLSSPEATPTGEEIVEDTPTETPTEEATPEPTDESVVDESTTGEEFTPEPTEESVAEEPTSEEEAPAESVENVLEQLPEGTDLVVLNEEGQTEPLATGEAAETLAGGDPYIVRGGVTHRFLTDCIGQPVDANNTCTESTTPIQDAIDFAVENETIYVEAGTYHEQLTINTANLTLYGDPGDPTLAGAGSNAPILDGSTLSGTTTGISLYAEGFTLIGFVIQNYDTAILQTVVSGNNTVTYENNTFQNNVDGINVVKAGGSPGIQMHYNIFQNNSGDDLTNIDPNGSNVQFIDATDNYWGCPEGPVIRHVRSGQGNDKPAGEEVYFLWRTSNAPNNLAVVDYPNEYGDCALLFGNASLYNNNGQGGTYDPYKIVIDALASPETPPPTEPTPTEPTPTEPTPTEPTPTEPTPTEPTPTEPTPTEPTPTEPTPTEPTPTEPTPTEPTPTEPTPTEPTPTEPTPTEPTPTEPTPTEPTPTQPTPTEVTPTPPPPTETPVPIEPPTEEPTRSSTVLGGLIPITGGETHAIAAGIAHTCALTPEGGVQCWGNNDFGQLGDGTYTGSNIRVNVIGLSGGTTIVAGGHHTCVLSAGDVWCWGQNSNGQIGDGTTTNRNTPVKVLSDAVNITAGLSYTCATMQNGQVMCWGSNENGQLADGGQTNQTTPTLATLVSGISNIDAGQDETCGLTVTGLIRCLASGSTQELDSLSGDNLDVAVNRFSSRIVALNRQGAPIEFAYGQLKTVDQLSGILDVDSGLSHICALQNTGGVYCWGSNYYGQLGNNSTNMSTDPVSVINLPGAWQLAVGKYHACAMITTNNIDDPGIRCWGLNSDGQLGDGTNENRLLPVEVK